MKFIHKFFIFLFCFGATHIAGIIGGVFVAQQTPYWYPHLEKPFFQPPDDVFSPMWFFLYTLMAVSFYLILIFKKLKEERKSEKKFKRIALRH